MNTKNDLGNLLGGTTDMYLSVEPVLISKKKMSYRNEKIFSTG
jgi:hypothetical protein